MADPVDTLILSNERERPGYAPYCLRHVRCGRMRKVAEHHWRCGCGAECDLRALAATTEGSQTDAE
jgi:hypothetical protein